MGETHEVVHHKLRGRDHTLAPGPNDADLLLGEDGQLVDHALGADLLRHADEEVGRHDEHEQHVAVLAGQEHQQRQGQVDAVEQRQGMLGDDLAHGLGAHVGVGVHAAGRHALGDLGVREARERPALLVLRHLSPLVRRPL